MNQLPFDKQYYIGVQFTGAPINMTSEMTGRSAVSAVAYAYNTYGLVARTSDPVTCKAGQVTIDTSVPGTHTIIYSVTDPENLTGSATRVVTVSTN